MSDRSKLAALAVLAAACVLALVTFRCVSRRDLVPGARLPDEYLGRWYFGGTSGGIAGQEVATADGSWIVITSGNTIEHHSADGRLDSTEAFEPARGRSIFSEDEAWILRSPGATERVLLVHPGGVLTLAENVYDGFGSTYTRSP